MSDVGKNVERFIDLVDQVGDEATGTFDILGVGKDERAHTRMLAWLLRPTGSHGLGALIIEKLLSKAGLSGTEGLSNATVSTFDQSPSDTELDIVIEGSTTIIVVEVKTQGRLGSSQYERQVDYLQEVISGDEERAAGPFESYEYVYLSADESHKPDFAPLRVTWADILEVISEQAGVVTQDTDAIRIREWTRFAKSHLTESERLSPATELQLGFPDLVEQYDVNLDFATVKSDRQRLLSSFWQWLNDEHPAVANGENGWTTSRSRIEPGTKYIRLPKEGWPQGMRIEIQATKERMTAGDNHSGPQNEYRTTSPHIEITLRATGTYEQRDKLLSHLEANGDEILRSNGFELIREKLPDNDTKMNKYHMYSKQVQIDFSKPENTVRGLRKATNTLLQLEDVLDKFEV
jgi:hypothetical protein